MRTPQAQISACKQLSLKKTMLLGEQENSRVEGKNIQVEHGTCCYARKQGWKDDRDMSKGPKSQLEEAPVMIPRTI